MKTNSLMTIVFAITMALGLPAMAQPEIDADGNFAADAAGECPDGALKDAGPPVTCACEAGSRAMLNADNDAFVCVEVPTIDDDGGFDAAEEQVCNDRHAYINTAGDKCYCIDGYEPGIVELDGDVEIVVQCRKTWEHEQLAWQGARIGNNTDRLDSNDERWEAHDQWATEDAEHEAAQDKRLDDLEPRVTANEETATTHGEQLTGLRTDVDQNRTYGEETRRKTVENAAAANSAGRVAVAVNRRVDLLFQPVFGFYVGGGLLLDFSQDADISTQEGVTDLVPLALPAAPVLEIGAFVGARSNARDRGGMIELSALLAPSASMDTADGISFGGRLAGGYFGPRDRFNVRPFIGLGGTWRYIDYRLEQECIASRLALGPTIQAWINAHSNVSLVLSADLHLLGFVTAKANGVSDTLYAPQLMFSASFVWGNIVNQDTYVPPEDMARFLD